MFIQMQLLKFLVVPAGLHEFQAPGPLFRVEISTDNYDGYGSVGDNLITAGSIVVFQRGAVSSDESLCRPHFQTAQRNVANENRA